MAAKRTPKRSGQEQAERLVFDPEAGYHRVNLDWTPDEIPDGAIRSQHRLPNLQSPHGPPYYYQDRPSRCRDCRVEFVFTAHEQKYWYETLMFPIRVDARRCADCRRKYRVTKARVSRLTEVAPFEGSEDPDQLIEFAATRILWAEDGQSRDVERAIAAARRAYRLDESDTLALYWEGRAHELAGRTKTAVELYRRFAAPLRGSRHRSEARDAVWRISELT